MRAKMRSPWPERTPHDSMRVQVSHTETGDLLVGGLSLVYYEKTLARWGRGNTPHVFEFNIELAVSA